ncbi:exodeoxyribonuclease VII large subunit [Reinekea marinisedimentorum]|uniref:Exodeoxyribonuclease 7 large subunit n=1 Tax=Reinekea marinisedimentorum TaxID=230495 RepID=A0A4R3I9E1_9GAMM|nr:exodeoxyribonuclease VII large subunit [Reinekea marinisedimentorum]TCS42002.1 exodeoxyribonuclease VII large subunit [Reinekea marinisedimentorum]
MWSQPSAPLSVSQLNRQVKQLLESQYPAIPVRGEISTLSRPASGHIYFTLKDSNAQIRCAMFKGQLARSRYIPKQGDEVIVQGRISLYEGRGDYQMIAASVAPVGEGELQAAFFQLKERLAAEGLFNTEHKKHLPASIQRVGLVTSSTGAAVHDILTVLKRRYPAIEVTLYPSQVQGNEAAQTIVSAIATANRRKEVDLLIVGRGGGSLEDLWCFNTEPVARAIFNSDLPVVSAVGHEVDVSIADFVADIRAATPSQAAELISPDQFERMQQLDAINQKLASLIKAKIQHQKVQLQHASQRLKSPAQIVSDWAKQLSALQSRLNYSMQQPLSLFRQKSEALQNRLWLSSPDKEIAKRQQLVQTLTDRMARSTQNNLKQKKNGFDIAISKLNILSPLATLDRGYSISRNDQGNIVKTTDNLSLGDKISTRLSNGSFVSEVISVAPSKPQD